MVLLVGLWERGWLDYKVESFMWRQLAAAYGAEYRLLQTDFGEYHPGGVRVFLDPFQGDLLDTFEHPLKAAYVFGRAGDNNRRWIRPGDLTVRIPTPKAADMFAVQAAAIVLEDRRRKHGD